MTIARVWLFKADQVTHTSSVLCHRRRSCAADQIDFQTRWGQKMMWNIRVHLAWLPYSTNSEQTTQKTQHLLGPSWSTWGRRRRTWCWTWGPSSAAATPSCPPRRRWRTRWLPGGGQIDCKMLLVLQPGQTRWVSWLQTCIPKTPAGSPSFRRKPLSRTSHWEPEWGSG